jgi:hypothetical protein
MDEEIAGFVYLDSEENTRASRSVQPLKQRTQVERTNWHRVLILLGVVSLIFWMFQSLHRLFN